MLRHIILFSVIAVALGFYSSRVHAQEALCAEVKIEILQELTMERQGFEALMRITNSLDSFALEDVSVSVNFADANGNPVVATSNTAASDAAFFIRIDDTRDISGLSEGGNGLVEHGSIAPQKVGELRWLIIPTANAAGQVKDGKLYFVGAQLRYSYGGKQEIVDVAADTIVVKPQPALTLDYFLTREIIGDDAFTATIEPPVPYTLGVRINNTGYGYAKSVKIDSAQPTIVENELGLAVDFKIVGSYVAEQPAAQTLLLNFGTIDSQAVAVGRWIMETNLAGKFTAFNASFSHADDLGGELTSLLQATNAHMLVRDVLVSLPGRDGIRDFLAYNSSQELFIYESENTGLTHTLCSHCAPVAVVEASLSGQGATSQVTHSPQSGFSYVKVTDPFSGARVLSHVTRSDGVVLSPRNAWLAKERAVNNIDFNYFIHIFDTGNPGSYTLHWGGLAVDEPQPPVIQYLSDRITYEGGSLGFLIQASDPNNTLPVLTAKSLPTGAGFVNQASNTGVFQWNPAVGQAGVYALKFVASDGSFTTERSVNVRVNPIYDIDGDGLDDQWERDHFGNLDQDGTGDADGDGRTDLQEFTEGTDPLVGEIIPGTPQILTPIYDADVLDGATSPYYPLLSVSNGTHGQGIGDVSVIFEVYSDESFTNLVANTTVSEGEPTTSVQLGAEHSVGDHLFSENRLYYWRARAQDSHQTNLTSAWVKSRFFINTANDAPSIPKINTPVVEGIVADVSPVLSVTNAADIDRDRLYYHFIVYEEDNLDVPLVEVTDLPPGGNGYTQWRVPRLLAEDSRYLWRVVVTDEHGLVATSEWGSFLISTQNHAPTAPAIDFPILGSEVTDTGPNNSVNLRILNATDPERAALVYYFELDTSNTFDTAEKIISSAIPEGVANTSWPATGLLENTTYYWRARASDGSLFGSWAIGEFSLSQENEAPSIPTLQNPVPGSVVATLRPLLEVNPAVDPEGGAVNYRFELHANSSFTGLGEERLADVPAWALDIDLSNGMTYYWRVRAEDNQGLASDWNQTGSFTVTLPVTNVAPEMNFVLPAADITVEDDQVLLQWVDSDPDSGARVSLYYHFAGGEPELIVADLSEDADGEGDQYLWDLSGLAPGEYTISAVIADELTEVAVNLCCVITRVEASTTGPIPGLAGSYFSYNPAANSGQTMSNIARARQYIVGRTPDLNFIATQFRYGPGVGNLGAGNNIVTFLGYDAASITGQKSDSLSVVLHFAGTISLEAGSYRFRVRADDGYQVIVNDAVVAQHNSNQSATTRVHSLFTIAEPGTYPIDIIYWDASAGHTFVVEFSSDGGATYQDLNAQFISHAP